MCASGKFAQLAVSHAAVSSAETQAASYVMVSD